MYTASPINPQKMYLLKLNSIVTQLQLVDIFWEKINLLVTHDLEMLNKKQHQVPVVSLACAPKKSIWNERDFKMNTKNVSIGFLLGDYY